MDAWPADLYTGAVRIERSATGGVCALAVVLAVAGCRDGKPPGGGTSSSAPAVGRPSAVGAGAGGVESAAPPAGGPAAVAPSPDGLASHQFYGVYLQGHKAGWAEERVEELEGERLLLNTRVHLDVKRMGASMKLELTDRVEYGAPPERALERFELSETAGEARAVRRGELRDGKLHVVVEAAGSRTEQVMDAPKERAHDTLPALLAPRLLGRKGEPIQTWQFDRQQLRDIPIETSLLSEKATRIQGVPVTILEVKGVDRVRGITMFNRLTAQGRSLEMALGPGLKLVLEDEAVAKNPSLEVPDLYRLSVVPLDRRLENAAGLKRLKVRLEGLPADGVSLVDSRQQRDGDVVTIHRRRPAELPQEPLSEADRTKWLEATAFIDHQHPAVRAVARAEAAGDTDAQKAVALTHAVHRRLSYTLATAPLTAGAILEGGRGDCTEYARALTALLRGVGVPAREVSGMAYAGDSDPGFAFHAWVEAHVDGRWLALDPTWDQTVPDATHIALSRDDPSAIVGLLGGLKARVLEAE